jgi:pyruvate dehydrogenase kinase 2/3/4
LLEKVEQAHQKCLAEMQDVDPREQSVQHVQHCLDRCVSTLISTRTLKHHLHFFLNEHELITMPEVAAKNQKRVSPLVLAEKSDLSEILAEAISHTTSISKQKYGVCPEIELTGVGGANAQATVIGSYVSYIAIELLKNSVRATVERYGELNVDDAPPITVLVSATASEVGFVVSDVGGGIPMSHRGSSFEYFATSAPKVLEQTGYAYSRAFGDALAGYGIGLPMARVYARHLGGDMQIATLAGHGTWASVNLCRHGLSPIVPLVQLDSFLGSTAG